MDEIIELLAGPEQTSLEAKAAHQELAQRTPAIMDTQRLVALVVAAVSATSTAMAAGVQIVTAAVRIAKLIQRIAILRKPKG